MTTNNNNHHYRQLMSELGIDDDRQEKALVDLLSEKDAEKELAKLQVSQREWQLEHKLMEMRCKYEQ